jgi:hypothetical protein
VEERGASTDPNRPVKKTLLIIRVGLRQRLRRKPFLPIGQADPQHVGRQQGDRRARSAVQVHERRERSRHDGNPKRRLARSIERFAAAVTAPAALNPSYLRPSRKTLIRGHRMKREGFFEVSARRQRIKTRGFLARVNRFVGWEAFRSELVKALPRQAHFLPGHNLRPGDHKPSQSGTQAC